MSDVAAPTNGKVAKAAADRATSEVGSSGILVNGGLVQDEFHPRLRGARKARTFREMQDNDPIVGSILYALQMLVRQIGWRVDPATPPEAPGATVTVTSTPEADRWAEFLESAMGDMSLTWDQTLSSILSFLPYGWAYHEVVYKHRGGDVEDGTQRSKYDDGLWGWRKWALRTQESLAGWVFDNDGGIQGMRQYQPHGGEAMIPIQKALLFRTSAARNDPEGRSVLRNAYVPWYRKKRIEEIEAIGIERDLAGLPIVHVPAGFLQNDSTPDQKATVAAMKNMVTNIRRNTQEGVVFPHEMDDGGNDLWKLELLTTGGRRQFDTDAISMRYAKHISMSVLADWVLLGHEKVGSYSLGATKTELFTIALGAWVDEVTSVINEYAVPPLMKLNGVPQELWPRLEHDEIRDVDLGELGAFLKDTLGSGAINPSTALESRILELAQLPQPDPELDEV